MPNVTTRSGRRLGLDLTPLRTSRDYRLVFIGGMVSGFGSFITYVTIPFQVAAITGDPLAVGLLGLCELLPLLLMAFVGGALADYLDRRLLVRGGELALAALCGVLLVNALSDRPHLWLLYAVAAATAAIDGIQRPALEAMVPRLVRPEEIPATSALQSLGMQVAQLGGPALAGILIATVDLAWVYAFDLATFAVSVACLTLVKAVPPPPEADRPSIRAVITGIRYARSRPELLGTYLVDINAMFFGMPQALYPFRLDRARPPPRPDGDHRGRVLGRRDRRRRAVPHTLADAVLPRLRGRRGHGVGHLPLDHLEPDHPRPPARAAGRDRDAVVHHRAVAGPAPIRRHGANPPRRDRLDLGGRRGLHRGYGPAGALAATVPPLRR
jgi:hypothetical protein